MTKTIILLPLFFGFVTSIFAASSNTDDIYFIDAHSQLDVKVEQQQILDLMSQHQVRKTILGARGQMSSHNVAHFAKQHPEQIVAAMRTESMYYREGNPEFYLEVGNQYASGKYQAMGEIVIYSAGDKGKYADIAVSPADSRVNVAVGIAEEAGWPAIVHIDFSMMDSAMHTQYRNELEGLLAQYGHHPILLSNMGKLKAKEVAWLIERHDNIFFLTTDASDPEFAMLDGMTLSSEWKPLVMSHPDRFVFAVDNVSADDWQNEYSEVMRHWRSALSELPNDVAHAVAHGNAERLWKMSSAK